MGVIQFSRLLSVVVLCMSLWACNSSKENLDLSPNVGLVSDQDKINLRDILQYQSKNYVFKIKNAGRKAVIVTGLEKSCGCTEIELAKETLQPGEETTLTAVLSAQDRVGGFISYITVKWKQKGGQEEQQLKLSLQGKAVRLIVCEPPSIEFGDIDADKSAKATLTRQLLIRRGDAAVEWNWIEVTAEFGQAIQSKKLDENTFQIQYSLSPGKHPVGTFKDEVKVRLKNNETLLPDEIEIPVIASIKSPLTVKPASVYLGSLAKGTIKQGTIKISHPAGKQVKILSVTPSARIRCEIQNDVATQAVVSYWFDAGIREGNVSEKLMVKVVCEKKQYELMVPFIAYAQ
jgi:hypothetical protein